MKIQAGLKIFILLSGFTACTKDGVKGTALPYEIIQEDYFSYTEGERIPAQNLAIQTQQEWSQFIYELGQQQQTAKEELEQVNTNFLENTLIILIEEYRTDCCNRFRIEGIYERENHIVVNYKLEDPNKLTSFAAISQVYLIVQIPKVAKEVVFQ